MIVRGMLQVSVFLVLLCGRQTHSQDAPIEAAPLTGNLVIYHAGSLTPAFRRVEAAFETENPEVRIVDKAYGAVDLARRVTTGGEPADLFATADAEDIDVMMKPKYAAYDIRFGQGAMVLVYHADDVNPAAEVGGIAVHGESFDPSAQPAKIPRADALWAEILARPGVLIGGSDPRGDPSGYRALMIMQLAERFYGKPALADAMKRNYVFPAPASADFRFVYESNALEMARKDVGVRIARLPDEVNLSDPAKNALYAKAVVTIPGLASGDPAVTLHGESVTFGVTVLRGAANQANAEAFVRYLLTPDKGVLLQRVAGPEPITPGLVDAEDFAALPAALRPVVALRK